MNGIILLDSNYTYEGDIFDNEPHGKGVFTYFNGDKYVGECKFGKIDGFGMYYYKNGSTYTGFFSYGKINGIGTFEDAKNIYKGTWRNDKKHGLFYRTRKHTYTSFLQKWSNGKFKSSKEIQYIQPETLITIKKNPIFKKKKYRVNYKGNAKLCIGCYDNNTNATNIKCGHVILCYNCLN